MARAGAGCVFRGAVPGDAGSRPDRCCPSRHCLSCGRGAKAGLRNRPGTAGKPENGAGFAIWPRSCGGLTKLLERRIGRRAVCKACLCDPVPGAFPSGQVSEKPGANPQQGRGFWPHAGFFSPKKTILAQAVVVGWSCCVGLVYLQWSWLTEGVI